LRARAVGLWTAAGAIAIAAGPVIGGLLIAALGWRAIFLVNLPICALGLAATFAWVPRPRAASSDKAPDSARTTSTARGIDPVGQLLAVVALTAFTGAVIEWRPLGLAHPLVCGSFMLALIAAIAFVVTERRVDMPMLPLTFFGNRTFSAAVLFGICVNLTYYGVVFVLSLYLQHARGETPLQAGLAFLPLTGGFLVSNVASGWVIGRFGARVPMIAGAITAALGYGLLHFAGAVSADSVRHGPRRSGDDHGRARFRQQAARGHRVGGSEHGTAGGRRSRRGGVRRARERVGCGGRSAGGGRPQIVDADLVVHPAVRARARVSRASRTARARSGARWPQRRTACERQQMTHT
jgi:MFS family permease